MAKGQIHLTPEGPSACRVDPSKPNSRGCPFEADGHYATQEEANVAYAAKMERDHGDAASSFRRPRDPKRDGFSLEEGGYYGDVPPRSIQIDALNDTAQALIEDGNTQLVAACGTGKSFMGRQLMRRMMEEEDANGVAIVLTSSVKLARDTAADLMPDKDGNYDGAMGEHDKDYNVQIIEVHNESNSMKTNGAIDIEKIASDWQKALDEGKRVVVVSTYQSADLVQKVQEIIGERAEADLLMNDEAHNILGQKKSASSSADAENSGYRSFANEIPGAIQAKHRLYATATPSLADSPDDDETAAKGATREEQIASLQAQAAKMSANGKERLTVYSDDELIVGRVSGAITQQTAIDEGYLTKPDYQIRAAVVQAPSADSFVDSTGQLVPYTRPRVKAEAVDGVKEPMTAQTYSAVASTINAMVDDPQLDEEGKPKNPVHNALAYTGSISQADAFARDFRSVAKQLGGTMDPDEAMAAKDSADPELRRRARLTLIAEKSEVMAAHSGNTTSEKDVAFAMFKGNTYRDNGSGWNPNKRVLANVDIFSEGVSINEIDTVVMADQAKTSERAMTQAVGRSLRTEAGNKDKNTGHVLIPQVVSASGKELNGGLITAASYGATRVERALSTRKLKGEAVAADETTMVSRFDASGRPQGSELAASIARTHVKSTEDLVASQIIERAHTALGSVDKKRATPEKKAAVQSYRNATKSEQAEMQRDFIRRQAESPKVSDSSWAVANKVLAKVDNSAMGTLRQSGRVVTSALSAGDFSAVSPEMVETFTKSGILRRKATATSAKVEAPERKEFLENSADSLAVALTANSVASMDREVYARITHGVDPIKARVFSSRQKGDRSDYDRLLANYNSAVAESSDFRDRVLGVIQSTDGNLKRNSPEEALANTLSGMGRRSGINFGAEARRVRSLEHTAVAQSAASGSADYEIDSSMVQKNGVLKAPAQRKLSELI